MTLTRRLLAPASAILVATGILACAPAPEPEGGEAEVTAMALPAGSEDASGKIDAEGLKEITLRLATDELAGRGPGSAGDVAAREYLIARLQEIGFEPGAADGGWEQSFDMMGITSSAPETWSFSAGGGRIDLEWWDEYIAGSGVQEPVAAIRDAELIFVGYGIQAPEYEWDDYKGVDVSGKVLVMMNNDPEWDPELFEGERRLLYGRWTYKYEKAAEMGAAAAIIIHTTPSAGYPFQVVQTSWTGEQFEIPAAGEPRIQIAAWTSEDAARRLAGLAGRDLDELREAARSRDFQPVPLGVTTSLELSNELRTVETANVLGLLPGRDPSLKEEVVIYSAHHDHLGVGKPDDSGDEIYNGAKDNAAGVAMVLEIGEAFASLPERPRRSILLALVAAEEQGLLGSAYYAAHPTVHPGRIAANINYDSPGIWGATRDVTFIGYGKSSLDQVIDHFAAEQGRTVKPDQFPDRGYFYRSDQVNLAKIGAPAMYLKNGTDFADRPEGWGRERVEAWEGAHYHQPSDEVTEDWDFAGMVEDTRLGFRCGLYVAEQDEMPTWNPGDEFEAARLEALADLEAEG